MNLTFQEYQIRKIINIHKHVDGPWFWGKYTAHPYIGCRSGCEFCYLRGGRYLGRRTPETFDTLIQVKVNAVERLAKEIAGLTPDIISVGDWQQPAEDRYQLSRKMLGVILEAGFPLFIVERSPLLTRDLDLLVEINRRSWAGVLFSISSLDPKLKRIFEPRSPGVKRRLKAMAELAQAGIQVGTSMMPVLPLVGDQRELLEALVIATRDHGGTCVLGGGLTMDGAQADWTLGAARRMDPELESSWRRMYGFDRDQAPRYGPPPSYNARLGLLVRELCQVHNLADRMPRYVLPGPLAVNKRLAEYLFLKTYDLELEMAGNYRIWAYRKAAWRVDEMGENIADLYLEQGQAGLKNLPDIGSSLAGEIAAWLDTHNHKENGIDEVRN
jgi:DNA repair photolyase